MMRRESLFLWVDGFYVSGAYEKSGFIGGLVGQDGAIADRD
jgi:hypothetical protein